MPEPVVTDIQYDQQGRSVAVVFDDGHETRWIARNGSVTFRLYSPEGRLLVEYSGGSIGKDRARQALPYSMAGHAIVVEGAKGPGASQTIRRAAAVMHQGEVLVSKLMFDAS